jgi:hypothetical protein
MYIYMICQVESPSFSGDDSSDNGFDYDDNDSDHSQLEVGKVPLGKTNNFVTSSSSQKKGVLIFIC